MRSAGSVSAGRLNSQYLTGSGWSSGRWAISHRSGRVPSGVAGDALPGRADPQEDEL
jgi:hypothetical protein